VGPEITRPIGGSFPASERIIPITDGRKEKPGFIQPVKQASTPHPKWCLVKGMIVTAEIGTGELADLIKKVQAGAEVLLTQGNKPVAKLVSASEETAATRPALPVHSLNGHRVLTPVIPQTELAEEMFGRR
jgi:prevent-host-death family protein